MKSAPALLCCVAMLSSGCNGAAVSGPIAHRAPFVLIVPYFALAGDVWSSTSVSVYKTDTTAGTLSLVKGSPFAAGADPTASALTPDGRFAYVVNNGSSNISAFAIDATTGALHPVRGSPFAVAAWASSPTGIVVDATGRYAYAVSGAGVSGFAIDATTGALKPISGSPFAADAADAFATDAIAVDRAGTFAYVLNSSRNTLAAYVIDTAGALKPTGASADAGQNNNDAAPFRSVSVDPGRRFAYVTASCCINVYSIDPKSGAPGVTAHVSLGPPGQFELEGFALDPTGAFAYALNGSRIYAYHVDATTGRLKALDGSAFTTAAGSTPYGLTIDPSGTFAYAFDRGPSNGARTISAFRIDRATGALTALTRSPFAVAASSVDPIARWFDAGRCAAWDAALWYRAPPPPHVKTGSEALNLDRVTHHFTQTARYYYDPAGHAALHYPRGDSGVIVTVRTSDIAPPSGVGRLDLGALQTTSGIKLGSSAALVVRTLGEPKVVTACNQPQYVYASDLQEDALTFTIGDGRVIAISEDLGG